MHWFDELTEAVSAFLEGQERVVCNAGLSVSGLLHVGNLRGEIVLNHFISTHLRERGVDARQHLVLYTQDPWKGKEGQRARFPAGEGDRYVGHRLIDVPDPEGCHGNWVEHHWAPFGGSLDRFAPGVEVSTTTELYRRRDMQRWVRDLVARAEEVRQVVNRYRPRNPHPEGWLPFDPYCPRCQRIGHARALRVANGDVEYVCECGEEGTSSLERGKLNWRMEWPVLWAILGVDVEPFGKDHAAPGGSRESCQVIAETILGIRAPFGIPYEWVGYAVQGEDRGDMGSSDFLGFGPGEWLEVADPEVLRMLFAHASLRRRLVLDLFRVDVYHQEYDQAEAAFLLDGGEEGRSYELAQLSPPPGDGVFQLPYRHAALLAQVAPSEELLDWAIGRLQDTGLLQGTLSPFERERVLRRLKQSLAWVNRYGSGEVKVSLLRELPDEVAGTFSAEAHDALALLADRLEQVPWQEQDVKGAMVELTGGGELPLSTKQFFAALYTVFLGKPSGPRAAPLLVALERDFVLQRLREVGGR